MLHAQFGTPPPPQIWIMVTHDYLVCTEFRGWDQAKGRLDTEDNSEFLFPRKQFMRQHKAETCQELGVTYFTFW